VCSEVLNEGEGLALLFSRLKNLHAAIFYLSVLSVGRLSLQGQAVQISENVGAAEM